MARIRLRALVDVIVDKELTEKQMEALHKQASVLVNTVPFAVELDDVKVDMSVERVSSVHVHDSTDDYLCDACKGASRDRRNRNN